MSDKRSVSTDALATLGTIIDETAGRDAIHLAVEPVVAAHKLIPGQDVGLDEHGEASVLAEKTLGIVDPFLTTNVEKGQMFWLIVYPRQITSLRHVWSHPDFSDNPKTIGEKVTSEKWVRDWIERTDDAPTYEDLISLAKTGCGIEQDEDYGNRWQMDSDYLLSRGRDACGVIEPALWDHLEVITGAKITERPGYFSCSC
jgi:hypothetical protein